MVYLCCLCCAHSFPLHEGSVSKSRVISVAQTPSPQGKLSARALRAEGELVWERVGVGRVTSRTILFWRLAGPSAPRNKNNRIHSHSPSHKLSLDITP